MAWHKIKILDVVTYLVFAGVALRGLSSYSGRPVQGEVIALLLAFLLLRVSEAWLGRRLAWYPHLYFAVQTCLILALSLIPPYVDYFVILYVPLSGDAMGLFSQRTAYLWIGIFCLATAGVLTYTLGFGSGLPFFLMYAGAYLFFGSYAAITRHAEEARAESEALLTRLQAAHRELQAYATQIEELTAAEERNRLARELHDSVTQTIFSMNLTAESARILLERDPSKVVTQLDRLQELSKDALAEMRSLISQLRPKAVAKEGLIPALRRHIAVRQQQDGLAVALYLEGYQEGERRLAPEIEDGLLRVVQEALNNVVKHAQTNRAEVRLCLRDDMASLLIEDPGVGFDPTRVGQEASHLGLTSMRERAQALGGSFEIESQVQGGTRVKVEVPLARSKGTPA
jgi:signal transduction histidine kinase